MEAIPLADFFYEYNSARELTRSYTYNYSFSNQLQDSTIYTWQDGNLIQEDIIAPDPQTIKWTYTANSDGWNLKNVPTIASRWIYYPDSKAVTSKNFPWKKEVFTNGTLSATTIYTLQIDKAGKITAIKLLQNSVTEYTITYEYL